MRKPNFFRSAFFAAALAVCSFGFTSCDDDNDDAQPAAEARGPYDQQGVFIISEGNYGTPNASLSFQSDSTGKALVNDVFKKANNDRPLGDVALDLDFVGDRAYITVNNSNKIEVVNAYTFRTEAVIENLKQPRFFAALNEDKAYVTEWIKYGDPGQVSVLDLKTNKVVKSIPLGQQPEELLIANGKLYVAVSGTDKVAVINTTTDTKEAEITVADGPTELELDRNNKVWVLATGKVVYNPDYSVDYDKTTAGSLSMINPASNSVAQSFTFGSNQSSPQHLTINGTGDRLYFNYSGNVIAQSISAPSLSTTAIINKSFYGIDVDPETGNIYAAEYFFTGSGSVFVYDQQGTLLNTFTAGIGPNGFVFR